MKEFALMMVLLARVLANYATAQTDRSTGNQAFVNDGAGKGKMEAKQGQLTERNGSSAAVKKFGHRMAKDHPRPMRN